LKAQIQVYGNNNVGIGSAATSASSTLSINTTGSSSYAVSVAPGTGNIGGIYYSSSNTLGTSWGIASNLYNTGNSAILRNLYGCSYSSTAQSTGQSYGVSGYAGNSTNGYNFAIFGQLQGTNYGAAIYGHVGTGMINIPSDAQWAGYFDGNAKVTGTLWVNSTSYTSDERLKKNINNIDSTEKLFNLKPVKYNFKNLSELTVNQPVKSDTGKILNNNISEPDYIKKVHYGLLAQDLQKIYPDLVYESPNGTLGIDYQGLIPIIIDQLKKMKLSLDDKDAKIANLEKKLQQLQKGKQ
jgi:hypothetical protein